MTRKEFSKIVSKKYDFDKTDYHNYACNKACFQDWFNSKSDPKHSHCYGWLLEKLNGEYIYDNIEGDYNLAAFYYYEIFTEEQWDELLPQIYYREF